MSKEKMIEEMAEITSRDCGSCSNCEYVGMKGEGVDCIDYFFAHTLYNAGYRKQSEGEWIPYESESYGDNDETTWYKCSNCGKDAYGRCWDDEWYSMPICSEYCPNCGAKMKGGAE